MQKGASETWLAYPVNEIGELLWWVLSEKSEAGIMGAVCCCLSVEDFEDYVNPNSSVYRNCICLSCFLQNFINVVCLFVFSFFLLLCTYAVCTLLF